MYLFVTSGCPEKTPILLSGGCESLLSAYARSEDRTKAIRSGFQNHLAKPVEPAELLAVVNSLAGRKVTNPPDAY